MRASSVSNGRITHFAHTFQHLVLTLQKLVHTDSPSFALCNYLHQKVCQKCVQSINCTLWTHFSGTCTHFWRTFQTMYTLCTTLYTLIAQVLRFVITFIKSTPKVCAKYNLHTLDTLFSVLYTLFVIKVFKCVQSVYKGCQTLQ